MGIWRKAINIGWKNRKNCLFCDRRKNNLQHYVEECSVIRERFTKLEEESGGILRRLYDEDLGEMKGEIIRKL